METGLDLWGVSEEGGGRWGRRTLSAMERATMIWYSRCRELVVWGVAIVSFEYVVLSSW